MAIDDISTCIVCVNPFALLLKFEVSISTHFPIIGVCNTNKCPTIE